MDFLSALRRSFDPRLPAARDRRRLAAAAASVRPRLEELEPRLVLSVPTPDHVVIVIEENHSYGQIIGNTSAPYINNTLKASGASFTSSYAITHPSQPNYLALFSGSTQGVTDNSGPLSFSGANLASELTDNGYTFGGYSEDLPYTGYTGLSYGNYVRRHNPWVDFTNVTSDDNMPFSSFPTDYSTLPTVSIVVPNLNNDMHDGSIATGDTWLKTNLDGYGQWAASNNSLLIVTWDEDDGSHHSTNRIPTLFVGPMVTAGAYSESINHYNVLRTVEDMYGLDYIGNDADASPITDAWVDPPSAAPSALTATTPSSSQVNLSWVANSTDQTGFKVERATDSAFTQDVTLVATTAADATSYSDTGLTAGATYYYRVRATNAGGDFANSDPVAVTLLPEGWSAADVGGPGQAGSTSFDGTTWTVNGGGADIAGSADQFQYAHQSVAGDATLVARVTSVQDTSDGAKAGVMFRDGTDAAAPYVAVFQNPNGQVELRWRDTAGGDSDGAGAPVGDTGTAKWVKLVRSGDTFYAYYAATDGTPADSDWVLLGSHTLALSAPTAGLAVTAQDDTALCTATFTGVSIT